jgi:hypothetical protein
MLQLLLGSATISAAAWVLHLAITAFWTTVIILLLKAFLVVMVTPTPETSWELLAVDPDVAKTLAVVILC